MKLIEGVWFPDSEKHLLDVMVQQRHRVIEGKITYQYHKLERAVGLTPPARRRRCVDIGGHVGTWSMWLAKAFRTVDAFEPVPEYRECFVKNVLAPNVTLHPYALGAKADMVGMREYPGSTGSTHMVGKGDIEMRTLDSFALEEVDFIKIDVEGLELDVVRGARDTIERCRPIMVVEQKGNEVKKYGHKERDQAVAWLQKQFPMRQLDLMAGDWIMGWK